MEPPGLRYLVIVGKEVGREAECEKEPTTRGGLGRAESRRTEAGTWQASAVWHRVMLGLLSTNLQGGLPFPVRCQKVVTEMTRVLLTQRARPLPAAGLSG